MGRPEVTGLAGACGVPSVRELIKDVLAGLLETDALILIEGGPGSGKTALASAMCFENAVRGRPCLYLTFRERRGMFVRAVRWLGVDVDDIMALGLFKFVRIPLLGGSGTLLSLIKVLTDYVSRLHPRIVVIDGIELALTPSKLGTLRIRSIMQNFLYDLPSILEGPVIITYGIGLPGGEVGLRELEYVADVVISLSVGRLAGGVRRVLKVVKDRGRLVRTELTPFKIGRLEPPMKPHGRPVRASCLLCPAVEKALGHVRAGECVLIAYPPDGRSVRYVLAPAAATLVVNGLKTALISLSGRSEDLLKTVAGFLEQLGLPRHAVSDYVVVAEDVSLARGGIEALARACRTIVKSLRPDVLTLHGLEVLEHYGKPALSVLSDVIRGLRDEGVIVAGLLAGTSGRVYSAISALSDKIVRLEYVVRGDDLIPRLILWSFGHEPASIGLDVLTKCINSLPNHLRPR